METSLNLTEPVTIDLQWRCGDVTLVATSGPSFVRIDGDADVVAECTVELRDGGRLAISSGKRQRGEEGLWGIVQRVLTQTSSLDLTVAVPEGSSLQSGYLGAGDITFQGRWDTISYRMGAGDVHIAECTSLELANGAGDVTVQTIREKLALTSAGGDIQIERMAGSAKIKNAGGDITACIVSPGATAITTMGGDLNVSVDPQLKIWADISTMGGDVERHLTPRGAPADGEPHLSLKLKTMGGDIILQDA